MSPIIGITPASKRDPSDEISGGSITLGWNYAKAVSDAGGVPILIPPTADMAEVARIIDGWLIPGGPDIDAKHFGEQNHPSVEIIDEDRFEADCRLYEAIPGDLPVFGICYGCQFLNVQRGGSLIQHLPDELGHDFHRGGTLQTYEIEPDSKIGIAVGAPVTSGKSYHHQSVKDPGQGLRVVARDEAGVVEALEAEDRPFMIGVQWHPERTLESPESRRLFESFVERAREYAQSRQGAR